MDRRRVQIRFGVRYDNEYSKIELIPDIVKNIISDIPEVSYSSTFFTEFTDTSIAFTVTFYIENSDYGCYLTKQHAVAMKILSEFEKNNIVFYYTVPVSVSSP